MEGIIYKITNLVNGKIYIGKTIKSLELRKSQHLNASKNRNHKIYNCILYRAFRKYGDDNFNWCIIDYSYLEDELFDKEKYWIDFYDSYNNGYNMTIGGEGTSGWIMTDKQKEINSERAKKLYKGEGNPMYGKKHSDISIYKNKKNQPSSREVLQFSSEGKMIEEYLSASESGRILKVDSTAILRACKGQQKHSLDYVWVFKDEFTEELLKEKIEIYKKSIEKKVILLFDKEGNFIKEYKTPSDCAKEIKGDTSSIVKCCKGKLKSHKGYVMKFKKDCEGILNEYCGA